ncbi:unnamed protein product [Spirodela intermedia]|uniref:Metallo-beta-lactamase domain-containing protein n=1 Tax=Spirodela intermedia TaxID=51605 RepID=A0A7I8JNB8_SPIIN|nr:unnamed protein product [Spirodela intermedia]CAA6671664.1 unnamed protein product [Spirodela intermedia]
MLAKFYAPSGLSNGELDSTRQTNKSEIIFLELAYNRTGNKNKRLNTSILIRYNCSGGRFNILIDAGKYIKTLRWFPFYGLLNFQACLPISLQVMQKTHYYLVDTSVIIPGAAVSDLQFNIIKEEPFTVHNLQITPLPVWHGPGYRSLGFRFGNVCYISDASDIPEETYELLTGCDLLIVTDRSSTTHFGLPRALQEVRRIQPKRTLFTGMMHLMDHDKVNEYLGSLMETEGLDIQLSYDGLRIPVSL